MSLSEAIQQIEDRAARVHCTRRGQKLETHEVIGYTAYLWPADAEALWGGLERGEKTPSEYALGWLVMLETLEKTLFLERLENRLKKLQEA